MLRRLQTSILRFFFRHLYSDFAWTYDVVAAAVSLGQWKSWIGASLQFVRGSRVLELAFGTGMLQQTLRLGQPGTVMGLDESPQMVRITQRRLRRAGLSAEGLTRGRAQLLPYAANTFDTVVATFPNEFIFDPQTFSEARRVLDIQGRLVVLPVAWIVGQRLQERAAAGLFRVTHQSPAMAHEEVALRFTANLEQAGFTTSTETVEVGSSIVLVVVGSK